MADIKTMPVYMVRANDEAAMRVVRKLCAGALQANTVIPLDADEFRAMQDSVFRLDIERPE